MREDRFPAKQRRNWGYWDGVNARKKDRYPAWAKPWNHRQKHPTDKAYGQGFWSGFYGEAHPNTGIIPADAMIMRRTK